MHTHNYVTSPEQNAQQHGSSNQASISNILQRPTTATRTIPHEFTLEQTNPSVKRRKSGGGTYVNQSHQSDQTFMPQGSYGSYQFIPTSIYYPMTSINQPMTVTSSRNNNVLRPQQPLGFAEALSQRAQSHTISNNIIFNNNNSDKPQALQSSNQVISNQNNHHVSVASQIIPQQICFQNQVQISNNNPQQQISQQQISQQPMLQQPHGNNQGQMQQISLGPSTSSQFALYSIPQMQLIDNQLYNNDNIPPSNISSTQESIIQQLENLKIDLENKDYFQHSCDTLYNYLQNENVYNSACQETLVQCLRIVKNKAALYGLEAASKVFTNAMFSNITRFSQTNQSHIKRWYNELKPGSQRSSINRLRQQQQQQQQIVLLQQQQQISVPVSQPRIEQRPSSDIEKANANWISRIIDRAWGHVMLPYESQMINQHQSSQQEFINSFYVPHEKFERIWKPETPFPPAHVHPNKLPISYRLISRKPSNLDDDNKCDWPPEEATFKIHINDTEIKLSRKQRIPIKQNQYSFVGVDKPVDIVQYLVAGVNRIKIIQCMCESCRQQLSEHILSIEILAKETEEIVLRNARSQTLTIEHGTEIVKRLISGPSSLNQQPTSPASSIGTGQSNVAMLIDDDDCDITVNKMKVSLRCPLSLLRISEPAKGQNCRHIGCFDLQTYVDVNKKNCKWRCPECNDRVTSETLRIDEYFKSLLRQIPNNVNTVELDSTGKWTVVGQDEGDGGDTTDEDDVMQIDANSKRSSLPSTSSKLDKTHAAIIILDDDDEPEPQNSNNNNQQQVPLLQNNVQPLTTLPTFNVRSSNVIERVPQRPKHMRQSSTPGVPYMQHLPSTQTNEPLQSTIPSMQSPPPSANITNIPIMQSPPDTTMTYMDPMRINNNTNNTRKKRARRSRRKEAEVIPQEKGNSITKDDNNNDNGIDKSSSGRSNNNNWSYVMGITPSQQNYNPLSQDIVSQTATQVASPISPVSVTNPNYSHPIQDEEEEGEWLTEDEQEEVVLDSSSAARNSIHLR